ncbi:MAG: acetylornithine transaminase [Nitrospiraceae bacterium]|nr:acetylornithine transaminase [Nitrospiraceae bacterium]
METKKFIDESAEFIMNTYNRFPIVLRKGRGIKVWDTEGKEYLDFIGGIAVNILGHCHPKIVIALQKQTQRLMHVSNLYHIEPQIKLAKLLVSHSFADKVFFCNSGAEANEAAIKLARKYAKEHLGKDKFEIITALNSFHGRTLATVAATGQEKFQKGFEPLMPGFQYVPFNDIDALKKAVNGKTCAVMLEPVQGEGGIKIPDLDYLKNVRELCDKNNILLIFDEVQTGIGRTGKLFAYENFNVIPDIMTLAKGLGNGFPIGAMLATDKIASAFVPGSHASTFGGNPLACTAAIATIETLLEDGFLLDQCKRMGEYMKNEFRKFHEEFPNLIVDVRGMGLLIGIEFTRDCAEIVKACLTKGLLINCTAGNVLRFAPPLIVQEKDIDAMTDILGEILSSLH